MAKPVDHRLEVATILALAMCNVIDPCDTCMLLANKQYDDLMKHPDDSRTLMRNLKAALKEQSWSEHD